MDENWYEGERNALIGILPITYIEIIAAPGDGNSQVIFEIFKALDFLQ